LSVDARLSLEDLAAAVGISPARITHLVRLGLLEPQGEERWFAAADVLRLRRMLRLRADLGIGFVSAAIMVDMVDRLDRAMDELAQLRRGQFRSP
jgi:DNA-binding transcriptional MerR regulator